MKPLKIISVFAVLALFAAAFLFIPAEASNTTAYTYTISPDDRWMRTQDAYLVGEILFRDFDLNGAEDLFIRNDILFIADTKNGRIVSFDLHTRAINSIGADLLSSPSGVYVSEDMIIYAADPDREAVVKMDLQGRLIREYKRPREIIFGEETQYKPIKVTVDDFGILNIVSDGAFDGIIQLNSEGEFLGYFGYNNIPVTFAEIVRDLVFTQAQREKLFNRVPLVFTALTRDESGIIYTVTREVQGNAVKKHNISGDNLLSDNMPDEKNFADLCIGAFGQIYAVTESGLIFEYSPRGALILSFGGRAVSSERNGLFTVASSIAADSEGCLYVLDKERNFVHTFVPTEFAELIHNSLTLYDSGEYTKSLKNWEELLKQSGSAKFILNGMADSNLQLQRYGAAAEYYKAANNRFGYSNAWWEIRNEVISTWLPAFIIFIPVLFSFIALRKRRKKKYADRAKGRKLFFLSFIRHPVNGFYSISREAGGGYKKASGLYFAAFAVFVADRLFRGFAFSNQNITNTPLLYVCLLFVLPLGLLLLCSYMVSEINNGEGWFRDVYSAVAYSFCPYIVFTPFIILSTHVLTLNEKFIVDFASIVIYFWVAILIFIALQQIHNYSPRDIIKNAVLSFFLMLVIILAVSVLLMFWDKILEILLSIVNEVRYRV